MQITNLLSVLPIFLTTALAVEIRAHWSSSDCGTSYNYYSDVGSTSCIAFGFAASSVSFWSVPGGAKGQIYGSTAPSCSSYIGEVGSGSNCIQATAYSANWFYPYKFARRETEGDASTGVQYVGDGGVIRRVKCKPSEFQAVKDLVDAGDWAALAEYPDDVIPESN